MKNKAFVIGAVAVAIILFGVLIFLSKNQQTPAPVVAADPTSGGPTLVRPYSPSFGNALARVTVVEWFDPECESCRAVHPFVKKVVDDYEDRVRFVLRYMPYHQNSMYAASVLEEARELGKYLEALDLLFEKQQEWGNHHEPKPELIPKYLATLGIAEDKTQRDYVIQKHGQKIKTDEADGNAIGIQGTPTFIVDGKPLMELSEAALRSAIDQALAGPSGK